MTSRRLLKAAEAIREVVSMAILTEIRDPRVQNVTVTGVEVAPDMKSASVAISVMGDEGRQHLCLKGLQNSAGFLQSRIADRIDTRYTPKLTFSLDTGLKKSLEVNRILEELARERESQAALDGPSASEGSDVGDTDPARDDNAHDNPAHDNPAHDDDARDNDAVARDVAYGQIGTDDSTSNTQRVRDQGDGDHTAPGSIAQSDS